MSFDSFLSSTDLNLNLNLDFETHPSSSTLPAGHLNSKNVYVMSSPDVPVASSGSSYIPSFDVNTSLPLSSPNHANGMDYHFNGAETVLTSPYQLFLQMIR